jgi:serine/threonine-protein kinase
MHYQTPEPGTLVADKYRIETLLGRGGMGAVFRARHELMDKLVALKWLHAEFSYDADSRERFLREARAAARIRHPNVVQVFDVGLHQGALFMVMELLEGRNFEAVLADGALPVPRALELLLGAMRGVAEAHEHGIIHRDIKPENIFVTRDTRHADGCAKVVDFGISKLIDDAGHSTQLTQPGEVLGTPEYMSYEHMAGARDLDARSDVYSFGVLLYRALTGISPFDADCVAAIAVRVATHQPPGPKQLRPELPSSLDKIVMKAMAFDRANRYPSMNALIDALTQLASTEGYLQALTRPPMPTPRLEAAFGTPQPGLRASVAANEVETRDLPAHSPTPAARGALDSAASAARDALDSAAPTPAATPAAQLRAPDAVPFARWPLLGLVAALLLGVIGLSVARSGRGRRAPPPPARPQAALGASVSALPTAPGLAAVGSQPVGASAPDAGSSTALEPDTSSDWATTSPARTVTRAPAATPRAKTTAPLATKLRPAATTAARGSVSSPTLTPQVEPSSVTPEPQRPGPRSGRMHSVDF